MTELFINKITIQLLIFAIFILQIERSQRWIGLNTILYDIKPHVIVINRLRANLYLFDKNGLEWMLSSNSVAMPSHPYVSIYIYT